MSLSIASLHALETLDSRGRPTLEVALGTAGGTEVRAGVPSGASTGSQEAVEVRDRDQDRYGGKGVLAAVSNVNGEIADTVIARPWKSQVALDQALIDLDGSPDKSRLGANAIVGVSMAAARAFADEEGQPLWRSLTISGVSPSMPVPHFNVVNGGAHATNGLDFQEFMVAPLGAPSTADAVCAGAEVYTALRGSLAAAGHSVGLGDEGGFAPDLSRPEEVLNLPVGAISDAGYAPGRDGVSIALDPAASEFGDDGVYHVAGERLSSADMIAYYTDLVDRFPIHSIEDGLGEDDEGWLQLTQVLGERIQLVGDDNFVTNPSIIEDAVARGIGNAASIKVNQVGTVTETLKAMGICRRVGYAAMVSRRSGETSDSFIADLAVGSGCGQLKSGAPARGERVAKYNRLIEIAATNPDLGYGS